MPIASRNQNLKVFPGIRITIRGNLKSEFKKILLFDCCRNTLCTLCKSTQQMSDTNFCKLNIFNLIECFYLTLSEHMYQITWNIQSLNIIITYKAVKK